MRCAAIAVLLFLAPAATLVAHAQQPAPPDDEKDVSDLVRAWRHKDAPPPSRPP